MNSQELYNKYKQNSEKNTASFLQSLKDVCLQHNENTAIDIAAKNMISKANTGIHPYSVMTLGHIHSLAKDVIDQIKPTASEYAAYELTNL